MALTGTTNTSANTAIRYLSQNQMAASSSLSKLSSGSRIVRASDDAAGLAVGTKLKADVTALKQAAVNAGQASSLLQVADGGMSQISDILQRMKALAVEAQSGSVTDSERAFIDKEYQALSQQIDNIATETKFNSSILLDGSAANTLSMGATTFANPDASASASLTGSAQTGAFTVTYDGTNTFTLTKPDGTIDTVQVTWATGQKVVRRLGRLQELGRQRQPQQHGRDRRHGERRLHGRRRRVDELPGRRQRQRHHRRQHPQRRHAAPRASTLTGTVIDHRPTPSPPSNSARHRDLDDQRGAGGHGRPDVAVPVRLGQPVDLDREPGRGPLDADGRRHGDRDGEVLLLPGAPQASVAMLAQANQMPQQMLRLLQ